ncbi:MAG: DUF4040 domain-containing protein [Bacteroidales bacterium]|nr:DUF4040 domain-containing protein [Bacteroidales bacterium]
MIVAIAIVLSVLTLVGAFMTIHSKKLSIAVISSGLVSLTASILFLLLAAPDVALTEASIGSGLTTIIFFYALNKIRQNHD